MRCSTSSATIKHSYPVVGGAWTVSPVMTTECNGIRLQPGTHKGDDHV
jgi:hypothetical protein